MRMNKDGLFKIMQITDMQEIPKVSPDTMALLDAAIEDESRILLYIPVTKSKGTGCRTREREKNLRKLLQKQLTPCLNLLQNVTYLLP